MPIEANGLPDPIRLSVGNADPSGDPQATPVGDLVEFASRLAGISKAEAAQVSWIILEIVEQIEKQSPTASCESILLPFFPSDR